MSKRVVCLVMCLSIAMAVFAQGEQEVLTGDLVDYEKWEDTQLESLDDVSIDALRSRAYGSRFKIVDVLGVEGGENEYQSFYMQDGTPSYGTYMVAYDSDGNRVYARVDVPAGEVPEAGYPVVVFAHGWVGYEGAPDYTLNYYADAYYGDIIDSYVDAGFMVVTPGFRGHTTVNGIPAEGLEFMAAFDNGSYVSPLFYAIDILNAVEGLDSLQDIAWEDWSPKGAITADLDDVHISGHSQGGDAVLTALAISGEGSRLQTTFKTGSIWSGCFPDRITQVETYGPMGESAEAFKAGTQQAFEWNGTAVGSDGSINPNFIFAWAPDWIGSIDPEQWSWQTDYFGKSVETMLRKKYDQMYDTYTTYVDDIEGVSYTLQVADDGAVSVINDPEIVAFTAAMSAVNYPEYLQDETIILHHSDQDYYALPSWNADLAQSIRALGGDCTDHTYEENNHSLKLSSYEWFDVNGDAVAGRDTALARDIALFSQP
ncbi:MAG: alpha/beta hydrolase [Spirochaetia bacterium]|nr:alpha/beta hydrolase [Spirochaetia bacterium]